MGRKSKSDIRKPEILEHFLEVFYVEGIEGASIAKIAGHMNVHPSLIMHYFKTKEEMVIELAELMFEKTVKPGLEEFKTINDLHLRFNKVIEKILFKEENNDKHLKLIPSIFYLAMRNDVIRQKLADHIAYIQDVMCRELELFMDNGIIKQDDPVKLVKILNMVGVGYIQHVDLFGLDKSKDLRPEILSIAMDIVGYRQVQ